MLRHDVRPHFKRENIAVCSAVTARQYCNRLYLACGGVDNSAAARAPASP